MCGRTCLSLNPEEIIEACKYKCNKNNTQKNFHQFEKLTNLPESKKSVDIDRIFTPSWRNEYNCGNVFIPSYNIVPSDISPVIVSSSHFKGEESTPDNRTIVPMMWGMIPFWHRGDYRKHGATKSNNCRLENILESKMYRRCFNRGQRCVILCEGFYEWPTTKEAKLPGRAPYFIYSQQSENICIFDKKTWTPDTINLLKIAGLFDVWENEDGDKIWSYSMITFEAAELTCWLHHRIPAILETNQQVNDWLDYETVIGKTALSLLRPCTLIKWHRVSNIVNNSRNKTQECNKPINHVEAVPQNKIMASWLNKRKCCEKVNSNELDFTRNDYNISSPKHEQEAKRSCHNNNS